MNKTVGQLKKIFVEVAKRNNDVYGMIRELRSMESDGVISSDDYDFLNEHWDEILEEYGLE